MRMTGWSAAALVLALTACSGGTGASGSDPTDVGTTSEESSTAPTASATPVADDDPDADGDPDADDDARGRDEEGVGTWTPLPPSPVSERDGEWATGGSAWTGEELLVWGQGVDRSTDPTTIGPLELLRFDPATDEWTVGATMPADEQRWWAHTVWTGDDLVVLGGWNWFDDEPAEDWLRGVRWNAEDDRWSEVAPVPLSPRWGFGVTWAGDEVVLWGGGSDVDDGGGDDGHDRVELPTDGAAWDPATNTWRSVGPAPIAGRLNHGAVWNGRRLVVFAGGWSPGDEWVPDLVGGGGFERDDAAVWDPATGDWATIQSPPNARGAIVGAVVADGEVVWWNGGTPDWSPDRPPYAGVWNPVTGGGRALDPPPMRLRRDDAPWIWAPELGAVVTFGGTCGEGCNTNVEGGGVLDLATGTWEQIGFGGMGGRAGHAIAWTGSELLVWGGSEVDMVHGEWRQAVDGARWRP